MAIDISADLEKKVTPEQLALLINQARELMKIEMEIGQLNVRLAQRTEDYRKMSTETLPDLMESVGKNVLPLDNGYTLELNSVVRASIPAESTIEKADDEERPMLEARRIAAFDWLRKNKAGSIIRDEIKILLGKGQEKFAKSLLKLIKAEAKSAKADVATQRKESVHFQTLNKYIAEKLKAGADVPLETFSVFNGREATIIAPKKEKRNVKNSEASPKG